MTKRSYFRVISSVTSLYPAGIPQSSGQGRDHARRMAGRDADTYAGILRILPSSGQGLRTGSASGGTLASWSHNLWSQAL